MSRQPKERYILTDYTGKVWPDADLTPAALKRMRREYERFGVYLEIGKVAA